MHPRHLQAGDGPADVVSSPHPLFFWLQQAAMAAVLQQRAVLRRRHSLPGFLFSLFCSFGRRSLLFFVEECSPLCLRPTQGIHADLFEEDLFNW